MLVAVLASDTVENGTTEEINDMLELPCASDAMVQGKVPKARPRDIFSNVSNITGRVGFRSCHETGKILHKYFTLHRSNN